MTKFISVTEYLMGRAKMEDLSDEQVRNLNTLIPKINDLLEAYGKPVTMSSGYRTAEDQARINPKVKHSNHMLCAAIDIFDPDKSFTYWVLQHMQKVVDLDLYLEDPSHCRNWLHIQHLAPPSKYRIFIP